jgi:hypothetical protein
MTTAEHPPPTPWPRYGTWLAAAAGGLTGASITPAARGAWVLAAEWRFGVASDAACRRRYERARIAWILARRAQDDA